MLDPDWVLEHAGDFDLMHIHFGFDAVSPATLEELVTTLRRLGKPLVLTVHDLRNPHHPDPGLHDAQLGVLVRAADALVTLTPGAAGEIHRRWGREATVLPHPHVVEEPWLSRPRAAHEGFVVGVHVKSLRASMAPLPVIDELAAARTRLPGMVIRVDAHTDVMTPGFTKYAPELRDRLDELSAAGVVDVHVHDYFSDEELWDYLQSLDVSVLPYRFGTHSGWLEACHDLGTTVLAPDCGYYAQQRPCLTYAVPGTSSAHPSLTEAVAEAYRDRPAWRADPEARRQERSRIASAHEQLYAAVLSGRSACRS